MSPLAKNSLITILVLVVIALLARYVVFKEQFDEWSAGLQRIETWQQNYRAENPDASDAEVDAAFRAAMANITVWQEQYKKEHPGATKAEMDAAFNAMFE